jgi:ABC-type multidrug transport system ATPase subunit
LEARGRGATFFISSHILSEVERVCDRVGIIEGGRLRKTAAPADLLPTPFLVDLSLPAVPDNPSALAQGRAFRWNAQAKRLRVFVSDREEGEVVVRLLGEAGYPPVQTLHRPASLRDAIEGHLS